MRKIKHHCPAFVGLGLIVLLAVAICPASAFAQKLQPSSSCGRVSDNAQFYVTSGLANRANCWNSWGSGKEYQVVVMQVPKGRPYGITEYTNSSSLHSNSLSWFDDPNKPDEFHLQTPAVGYGVMHITTAQLPAWAINIISDNRDIFEYLIKKTNLTLPSLQDDPKTVGRGVRGP